MHCVAELFRVEQRVAEGAMMTKWKRTWEEARVTGSCVDDAVIGASGFGKSRRTSALRTTRLNRSKPNYIGALHLSCRAHIAIL